MLYFKENFKYSELNTKIAIQKRYYATAIKILMILWIRMVRSHQCWSSEHISLSNGTCNATYSDPYNERSNNGP